MNDDLTASAFANSWNNLPHESVYTLSQYDDWTAPLSVADFNNKSVLELGCGNGSLLYYSARRNPLKLLGVDLGDSVESAREVMKSASIPCEVIKADMVLFKSSGFDIVYSIGVLHHLKNPRQGFDSVVSNTISGGKFHCSVYAHEGNLVVRLLIEPIRKVASKLPWWITKYFLATPLVVPYFFFAKSICFLKKMRLPDSLLKYLPLFEYSLWIGKRNFLFFRHVAFDQLVTPQTAYIKKEEIQNWLSIKEISDKGSYIIMRNGNSWKFGGVKR